VSAAAPLELHRRPTADLRAELRRRLATAPAEGAAPRIGHYAGVDPRQLESLLPAATTRAAVLIPIVDRGDELSVLFTIRADALKHHASQVSFPGGRLEAGDADATAAALRETEEEIGLSRRHVEILGRLADHAVITGYRVTPVVGLVHPGFELVLDPTEVAGSFEAPLRHLLDPANHARRRRRIAGQDVETFDLPWGSFDIWGATAGMLLTLFHLLGEGSARGDR
jgi:8-oxo-dGTP pyrophosphatase MutT (NUDIX family)